MRERHFDRQTDMYMTFFGDRQTDIDRQTDRISRQRQTDRGQSRQ